MSEQQQPPGSGVPAIPAKPRLLTRVRMALHARHYSPRTVRAYVGWIRRFIFFHEKRHPDSMGAPEVARFLSCLATQQRVSASTQNQAFSALLFLYREVLSRELAGLDQVVRARQPLRLPLVLAREEVAAILRQLTGTPWLMASLMYGAGLRLLECARLRVKDLDFARGEITVRDGKGRKDRVTVLPTKLAEPLAAHLRRVRHQHGCDLGAGAGFVALPDALARKYGSAAQEWAWQWVFPATRIYADALTGQRRRHHLHETVLQRAFKQALRIAGVAKPASCHSLRHYAGSRIMPGGGADQLRIGGSLAA
jgi:integron integrase